jgi:hypothetical protein
MSKRRIPSVLFLNLSFETFYRHFPPQNVPFLMCQFKCISGKYILSIFTFAKTLNHSPAQNLPNKKKPELSGSSVGRDIPPTVYQVLTN